MTLPGHDLDTLLTASKPDSYEYDATLRTHVRAVSIAAEAEIARESSRQRVWWRRPRVVIGALGVLLLGTTGGAMASQFNFADYLIGGKIIQPDVEVPIYYETATGKTVHCTIGLVYGHLDPDADVTELKSFVANHDWSRIGQRLYEEAMSNPFTPGPNDDFPADVSQSILDTFSFNNAIGQVIEGEIPPELFSDGTTGNMPSNCDGTLR